MPTTKALPGYLRLDKPYAPINDYILAEQAAGRLAGLEPWDAEKPLHEAIKALCSRRAGYKTIANYYQENSDKLQAFGRITIKRLLDDINLAPYADREYSGKKSIPQSILDAAMAVWQQSPDREPKKHTRTKDRMVPGTEIVPAINAIIQWMDDQCILETPLEEPIPELSVLDAMKILSVELMSPDILNRRYSQGIPVWAESMFNNSLSQSAGRQITASHDSTLAKRFSEQHLPSNVFNRLHNFNTQKCKSLSIRAEDLPIITSTYWHYAHKRLQKQMGNDFGLVTPMHPRQSATSTLNAYEAWPGISIHRPDDYGTDLEIAVITAIETLKSRPQKVIRMRFEKGLTQQQSADKLGITCNILIGIEKRALDALRSDTLKILSYLETHKSSPPVRGSRREP